MAETKKYKVLNPVDHDGIKYKKGEDIPLSYDQAKPLLKLGCITTITTTTQNGKKDEDEKEEGDKKNCKKSEVKS